MKPLHIITFLLFFTAFNNVNAQFCFCQKDSFLNDLISCDTILLKGHSKVYYQFNCDASWLTFENSKGEKSIIFSLDSEMIDLTNKLGWHVWKDYNETVLFVARETSGLPTTLYYSLLDKKNVEIINTFGQVVYACSDSLCDFILYFSDTTFNDLTLLMLDKTEEFKINLPKNVFKESIIQYLAEFMYVENLFDQPKITGKIYTFPYTYFDKKSHKSKKGNISIDLQKYGR